MRRLGQFAMSTTRILKVDRDSISFGANGKPVFADDATKAAIEQAAQILKTPGGVVAFPTETVYGLGGSSLCTESVKNIYAAKHRPADNPLISHIASLDQLKRQLLQGGEILPVYKPLIDAFWPGPLTIILPILPGSKLSPCVTANQPSFTVRMPVHPVARALIAITDLPIAAPSANASTRPSPTQAMHVYHDLKGRIPLILDGGPCEVGLESTVVDGTVDPPMLLRPGGVSVEAIREVGGPFWKRIVIAKKTAGKNEAVKTPGMKYRHYSPTAKVVVFMDCGDGTEQVKKYINQHHLENAKIAVLRSKHFVTGLSPIERDLGQTGSEIQKNMFAELRETDELGVDYIFVEGVSQSNEGLAIMNRLTKAASEVVQPTN